VTTAGGEAAVPEHLAGVPACLHKYEALLLRAWLAHREAEGAAGETGRPL
jgi:hypothetical protein